MPEDLDLGGLSPASRRMLETAAAMGREFQYHALRRLIRVDEESLAGMLDEVSAAGYLEELPQERFRWRDEETRLALYERIPPARRPAVHGRIAAAIAVTLGDVMAQGDPDYREHLRLSRREGA